MKNRTLPGIMLTLLLIGMLTLGFNIQSAEAEIETKIFINADGSVDPPTAPISSVDNVTYYFTNNINDKSIFVMRDNILLFGAGFTLQSSIYSIHGIILYHTKNVTVKNTRVVGFNYGISVHWSNNSIISNNSITGCFGFGIVVGGNSNTISNNSVTGILSDYAVIVARGKANLVHNNSLTGILGIEYSSCNRILAHRFSLGRRGIIWLYNSDNNTVSGNIVRNGSMWGQSCGGIRLFNSDSNKIFFNEATYNARYGILLNEYCAFNVIKGNNVSHNGGVGIHVDKSGNNTFSENIVANNTDHGILVAFNADFNTFLRNTISNNTRGRAGYSGVGIYYSNGSVLEKNSIENNYSGIYLHGCDTQIFHNNFMNNTVQAHTYQSVPSTAAWDDGFPSGGNYWSDYSTRYPEAQELDDSGVWNTPYVIDGRNQDNYPLMEPWTPIEVPPVEDTEAYIEYVNETIHDLPDEIFSRPEEDVLDVKNDFSDLFNDTLENINEGNYEGAIEKLSRIKERIYEETMECAEREELISLIDNLIAYLETLQQD